jgi:hypothetical protein
VKLFVRIFPGLFLFVNGIIYCVLAYLFIADSQTWFASLGIELQDATGYTELNTMYIGLMSALGIFSLLSAISSRLRFAGVVLALISYAALAAVRSWGIFVAVRSNSFMLQLLWAELASLLLAALALYCLQRSKRQVANPYRL